MASSEPAEPVAGAADAHAIQKVDPIAAVQDSIDGLALSLFEALRGVRDSVAPEALDPAAAVSAVAPFQEEPDELGKNATAKDHLLNGLNGDYFPPRAFDLQEPDYHAFLLAYLGDDPYATELAARFEALERGKELEAKKASTTIDGDKETGGAATKAAATSSTAAAEKKKPELGDVGYEFRKKFDAGWFSGKVTAILPNAPNGYDRRCVYTDGDAEDLRLEDLRAFAAADPDNNGNETKKPRLSIKLKVSKPKDETPQKEAPAKGPPKSPEPDVKFPLAQAEYTKLLLDTEHERDVTATQTLARNVLAKSAAVDDLVANLPGMHRTREVQMARIAELIQSNHAVDRELEDAHAKARERREEVRRVLGECTCSALGVEEEAS